MASRMRRPFGAAVGRVTSLAIAATLLVATAAASQSPPASVVSLDSLLSTPISTAAKYGQRLNEVAGSVTIVTADDIERYGYRTLDQVLTTVPGFYVSSDRDFTHIGDRGFGRPTDHNNRILLLVDGNTVNEGVFGAAPFGGELAIPLASLERIEIVRGPGSAMYGTGAIFGVVNLITRTAAAIDGGHVAVQGGSYGRRGVEGLYGHRSESGLGVVLSGMLDRSAGQDLFYPEYDSAATNAGIAPGLDGERRLGLMASLTRGGFRLHGRYSTRRKAVPTAPFGSAFAAPGAFTWDQYGSLELNYEHDLDARRHLFSRAYYNHYLDNSDFPFTDSLLGPPMLTAGTAEEVLGSELGVRWDLASSNRLTVGGEFRRSFEARLFSPRDTHISIDLNGPSTVVSGYLQDEHQFSRAVSLLVGVRYDAYSTSRNALTPRAAVLVQPSRSATVKLLYGEAFRAPNVYELGIAGGPFVRSQDLRPERIRTLELVWQQQVGTGVLWSSSLFTYRMRDLIDLTFNPATGLLQYRNVSRVRSSGFESGVDLRFGSTVSGFASYTYQRTIDVQSGDRLTNSPAHLLKGGLSVTAAPWLRPGLTMRYESSRGTVYGTRTNHYFLTDLNLAVLPLSGLMSPRLELGVRINNLFNTPYATPAGGELVQRSIPQDGRNLSAELRYGF